VADSLSVSRSIQRVPCTKCKRHNDPWRSFCGKCGSSLLGACRACGAVNGHDDKFCGGCAVSLSAAKIQPPKPPKIPKPKTHTIPIMTFDESILLEIDRS
jgi:hypothetical protein